ncbi:MAG: valine--tRNA ligase [Ardenticatenaceae bacterium]|nr:valine--tRNA ligase [Ardenticatenaceae bacterium]
MSLSKRYNPQTAEPRLEARWQEQGVYHFEPDGEGSVYSIDTPPPTVSGHLHLGHVYSYSQTDFFARFWRMNGNRVFYPMGFDDNGLPTERLVERRLGLRASDIGREAFIEQCLAVSEEAEKDYRELWQRLGLSIDWRYSYRTIDEHSRRLAQWSFLDLYEKGLAYREKAPSIWCPECQTAIAQAELDDLERETTFYTLDFRLTNGSSLPIATTRPELLPACVAVFVHPEDGRFTHLLNETATVPHFGQTVPILADPGADPQKGTGAVMCCTFGDQADVEWWHTHHLPLVEAIGRDGKLTEAADEFAGLPMAEARQVIVAALAVDGLLLGERPSAQSIRIHERCDTAVEYIITWQWFIRLLDAKDAFLEAGEQINWQPPHMKARYQQWVENLNWDWCITRQRYFGVTFPIWYCNDCGAITTADPNQLPIDPTNQPPNQPCTCGNTSFTPEQDVMDTWATSSLTPQIVGQLLQDEALYETVFPFSLRPQAHEIIRTWAFYTIVKSHYHFGALPWDAVAISGWGLAPEGTGKISKSRGGGPVAPLAMIEQYSADAVRYWAASTALGKDAVIDEQKIQAGAKLVTKLWNVARFSQRFLTTQLSDYPTIRPTPADRWILARTQLLIARATQLYANYDYATAKSEIETFFWHDLADNYLEMAKMRLYAGETAADGAKLALYTALLTTLKLLAPLLPYVTEQIYQGLFAEADGAASIHLSRWPVVDERWVDDTAVSLGETLLEIATAVRRYKSEHNLSLGAELPALHLATTDEELANALADSPADLISISRAQAVHINQPVGDGWDVVVRNGRYTLALEKR